MSRKSLTMNFPIKIKNIGKARFFFSRDVLWVCHFILRSPSRGSKNDLQSPNLVFFKALSILFFIFIGDRFYYFHFIEEETEVISGKETCTRSQEEFKYYRRSDQFQKPFSLLYIMLTHRKNYTQNLDSKLKNFGNFWKNQTQNFWSSKITFLIITNCKSYNYKVTLLWQSMQ